MTSRPRRSSLLSSRRSGEPSRGGASAGRPAIADDARSRLRAREAELLRALYGGPPAVGMNEAQVGRTVAALTAKRLRQLRGAWPALTHALGGELERRFEAYARATPPPDGGATADGLVFAETLLGDGHRLPDEARVELALVRARLRLRRGRPMQRGGPFATVVLAARPPRAVVVAAIGGRRPHTLTVGWPAFRRRRRAG